MKLDYFVLGLFVCALLNVSLFVWGFHTGHIHIYPNGLACWA